LVALLEADKEGFLRSETSLMQVSGRAARNINGKVIFYAERVTRSMQLVIDECDRRREIQAEYNREHDITPSTIYKSVEEVMISTSVADARQPVQVAEAVPAYDLSTLDQHDLSFTLDLLRREMKKAAEALQFEDAARLRDEIIRLGVRPGDRVLEIGTGSGYQAAVLAVIVKEVYTIEIIPSLAESAAKKLKELGYDNVFVMAGDGFFGWPEHAPFDAIIVTAAAERIPVRLIEQMAKGGRLIMPVGPVETSQRLTLVTKRMDGRLIYQVREGVRFVPMTGRIQEK
ncbi:hypothetical protein LCGC14_1761050, partial [marine sediment metagenome]